VGPQLPSKAAVPEQNERRLVVLRLGRHHQRGQDDPSHAAVDVGVVSVAEAGPALSRPQRGGVGVGGTGSDIGRAAMRTARLVPVRAPRLPDPVMARGGAFGQGGERRVRQRDRQAHGLALAAPA
jgi:hypothetical protein